GGLGGLGLQGAGDDAFDSGIGHRPRRTRPRVIDQAVEPLGDESVPPGADGGAAHAEADGHGLVARLVSTTQDDAGAERESLGTLGPTGPRGQLLTLDIGQNEFRLGTCHTASCSETITATTTK